MRQKQKGGQLEVNQIVIAFGRLEREKKRGRRITQQKDDEVEPRRRRRETQMRTETTRKRIAGDIDELFWENICLIRWRRTRLSSGSR
jgi:hypothetical protein